MSPDSPVARHDYTVYRLGLHTVYEITGPGGRVYVGCTRHTLRQRWLEHLRLARYGSALALHISIRKHGADAHTVSIFFQTKDRHVALDVEWSRIHERARESRTSVFNAAPYCFSRPRKRRHRAHLPTVSQASSAPTPEHAP